MLGFPLLYFKGMRLMMFQLSSFYCVYIYMHLYICTYVYMYTCINVYVYLYIYVYMYIRIHACMDVCMLVVCMHVMCDMYGMYGMSVFMHA